jgi:bidirectional [NiFe] hydrogenase diaphorase subunit
MDQAQLLGIANYERQNRKKTCIRTCVAAGCLSSGSDDVRRSIGIAVETAGLTDQIEVRGVGCLRLCCQGPLVRVDPEGALYQRVSPADAAAIVESVHSPVSGLARVDVSHPFFSRQRSIVLETTGIVDPERIETYIAEGGYQSLAHALSAMSPGSVVSEVTRSGLRGRGGAGFPTGVKWATVAKTTSDRKYVVCNADEGDPGAFMDRSVMESDPHRLLEGMAIAAYAVGSAHGYIYVRGEYPLAIRRLRIAIAQASQFGLLGNQILGSRFDFSVEIRVGEGAFVCGEETALLASIEGRRGHPRPRPPFPAEKGLWGRPTLINNVETFANIPAIIREGGEWFASIGTPKSPGTKVFSLTGHLQNTGLIEVPMGMSLREIVEDIGGGGSRGKAIKAVQTGGSSGGCIPAEHFDTSVDFESLALLGSIMGSGGMVVLDEDADMVDVARFFLDFGVEESCGKCVPCRTGTAQLHGILDRFIQHEATERDIALLEELSDYLKNASLCGLGQNAPNPVMSTLRHFRNEYLSKIRTESAL